MACTDCINHQIGSNEFLGFLATKPGFGDDFPLSGSIELTLRCNVRCKHCYILYPGATDGEMSTSQVKQILDKLADRGVLFLLMTGGEILARSDFREVYLYAKRKGFIITLFTNGTLVTEELAAFLAQWPPRWIEITIYGHTEKVYEAVTGVQGSFKRYRRGVDLLLEHNLPLRLKTMVMKTNLHEFESMRDWAENELGLTYRFDCLVNPKLDGNVAPLAERLTPEEVVQVQGTSENDRQIYLEKRAQAARAEPSADLFQCGAGVRTFHVDPRGQLHPCMVWRSNPYNLLEKGLDRNWDEHVSELRSRTAPEDTGCTSCLNRYACGNCAATSQIESGVAGKNIDYYCSIGAAREKLFDIPTPVVKKASLPGA